MILLTPLKRECLTERKPLAKKVLANLTRKWMAFTNHDMNRQDETDFKLANCIIQNILLWFVVVDESNFSVDPHGGGSLRPLPLLRAAQRRQRQETDSWKYSVYIPLPVNELNLLTLQEASRHFIRSVYLKFKVMQFHARKLKSWHPEMAIVSDENWWRHNKF